MRGQIYNYDPSTGMGWVTGEDGASYMYNRQSSTRMPSIQPGLTVDFTARGEEVADMYPAPGQLGAYAGTAPTGGGIDWSKLFFSPDGRIRRSHYWAGWGILFGIGLVLGFIPFVGQLIALATIWPNICIHSKRLHDMGRTGWWQLLPIGTAIVLIVAVIATVGASAAAGGNFNADNMDPTTAVVIGLSALIYLVVSIGFWIWVGATPGERGPNRFGPPTTADVAQTFA